MRRRETLRIALGALRRNRLRTVLTVMGVVIGTASVLAMVAIGTGARARVAATFEAMGTHMLIVLPGSIQAGGLQGGFGTEATITWGDVAAMATQLPSVQAAAPVLRTSRNVQSESDNWTTLVVGTTPAYFVIRDWRPRLGRLLDESDESSGAKVVVLGQRVVERLFGAHADPVGQRVRIGRIPFVIAGVLAEKGQSPMGQDWDDMVFVPGSTFRAKMQAGLGQFVDGVVLLRAVAADQTTRSRSQVESLLRERHRIAPGGDDDFSVRDLSEIATAQRQGARVLTLLLASIAAVSLLVGGIGITNIMLVSVTERTREVGVRMAVGARGRDIQGQFVAEALVLALAGGVAGLLLGVLAAWLMARAFHWPLVLQPMVALAALGFSAVVGVGFGIYPARRAARLDPIEALRFE